MPNKSKPEEICFVVSPIGGRGSEVRKHADWVLHGIIEPVFKEHYPAFKIERSDTINAPGQIDAQIINRLITAKLVIADLSMLNPNVFYEIGIRHMIQLPIIHMQKQDEVLPFDVGLYRAIKFSRETFQDIEQAKADLLPMLQEVLDPAYKINNPVTAARGQFELEVQATPADKLISTALSNIEDRLQSLEIDQGRVKNIGRPPRSYRSIDALNAFPSSGIGPAPTAILVPETVRLTFSVVPSQNISEESLGLFLESEIAPHVPNMMIFLKDTGAYVRVPIEQIDTFLAVINSSSASIGGLEVSRLKY